MNSVVSLVPRGGVDAAKNLGDFLSLVRGSLSHLIDHIDWSRNSWNVTSSFVRKGKPNVQSWLHFYQLNSLIGRGVESSGRPLESAFGEFARAYTCYQASAKSSLFDAVKMRLDALSYIEASFRDFGLPTDISKLSAAVLNNAVRIGCVDVSPAVQYNRARCIEGIYRFCLDQQFLPAPFVWKHGKSKAKELMERVGPEFSARRADKLPSQRAIDVLALAYCEPKNFRDRVFTSVTAVCLCVPIRIHEVLQLKENCGCSEPRVNDEGFTVPAFGFRAYPGKGNAAQVKWVPDIMEELAREAYDRLQRLSGSARVIASWYVDNPNKLYLPADRQHLRTQSYLAMSEISDLLNVDGYAWARKVGLPFTRHGSGQEFSVSFSDFEEAIIDQLPNDFPLHNGQTGHGYAQSLIVIHRGAMNNKRAEGGSRVMFEPLGVDTYNTWLSGTSGKPSVFIRYGFSEADGSEIYQTSHGFRHWLNDIAHRRGLSTLDIAHWSGRDPAQNKFYDHQTPAQFHAQLLDLTEKAGGIGPLFEAADNLASAGLLDRSEFLKLQIGSAHQTDVGACIHDYSLLPCQKFGNCIDCSENVFIKGTKAHRAKISANYDLTFRQLEAALAAMGSEYGADLWVNDHRAKLAKLATILSIHDDPSIAEGTIVNLPVVNDDDALSLAMRQRGLPGST